MIGLSRLRALRAALVVFVLLGGVAASGWVPGKLVLCSSTIVGDTVSLHCDDPALEAQIRAGALSPAQARSVGCEPITFADERSGGSGGSEGDPEGGSGDAPGDGATGDGPDGNWTVPEVVATGEPEPSVPPRTTDPAITARVVKAWDRIERWLGAHASATLRKLKPPAEPEDLTRWENSRGRRIPDALYASYLRHNGADGNLGAGFPLPASHGLLGYDDIDYVNWGRCQDIVMNGDVAAADPEKGKWHGSLLAIAHSGYGSTLFVEPRSGRVGESVSNENLRYDGPMGWPSYLDLLEALAGSLEAGTALRDWYPTVTSACELRWAEEPGGPLPGGCAGSPRPTPSPTPTVEPPPDRLTPEQASASGCRPKHRAAVVRAPDPRVSARVNTVWRRIEAWLARRAPATHRTLHAPATPRAIAKAEAAMGMTFPDDLRASLLRHDGTERWNGFGPAPFYAYMSVKALYADWKMLCGITLDGPEEMAGIWWDGHLIPFASAIDGGNLFIDSGTGKTGEFFNETGLRTDGDVVWPSYLALLEDTARSLHTGRPLRGWRPTVKKGFLDWKRVK
ncbi:hypothetical protein GCM10022226_28120 [Sphaerisporangium flaviroseum]|uniref:Knr4/Smi1-like domain-containing protein n=1 Tax=Sphaerisporangium flaviroseum TaxID=509199 RepID=A0ABP7I1K8_9ACTN